MQHYGTHDVTGCTTTTQCQRHVDHILKKYPELLVSLNCINTGRFYDITKLKWEKRLLRRDTERIRRHNRKARKLPMMRLKQFESALLDSMDHTRDLLLFSCPVCRGVLTSPVTAECGHSFCCDCLDRTYDKCVVCEAADIGGSRSVNVLVQGLVEKWRERNKSSLRDPVPNTADILGIQPRYHLRSGFIGLQINDENRMIVDEDSRDYEKHNVNKLLTRSNISNKKFNTTVSNLFKEVDDIKEKAVKSCWQAISVSDLECILCSRCILEPVTTDCGHTFCRGCLVRVLDHGLSCPLCMAPLGVKDYSRGSTVVLEQAIRFLLPQDYQDRLTANAKEVEMLNRNSDISVFICTNAFPGVACPLYVCEPRYRLLVRRCLLSPTRRFAMAAKEHSGDKFVSYGTVLEVKDAVHLEDGSFILTTVGVQRFKVVSKGEQDGYDTSKIQIIKDTVVAQDKLPYIISLHQKVHKKASKWIDSLTPKILAEVERLIGRMPKVEKNWLSLPDGPSWTWWLMPILPLTSQLQVGFLSTTNLEKRLRAIDKMLERMEIRMKGLERNTSSCSESEDTSESCSDSERTFEIPFRAN